MRFFLIMMFSNTFLASKAKFRRNFFLTFRTKGSVRRSAERSMLLDGNKLIRKKNSQAGKKVNHCINYYIYEYHFYAAFQTFSFKLGMITKLYVHFLDMVCVCLSDEFLNGRLSKQWRQQESPFTICSDYTLTPPNNMPFKVVESPWLSAEHLFQSS